MFTVEQIHDAHSKVKTGADFPAFVQELIQLRVSAYSTFVRDGHTEYRGPGGFKIHTEARYPALDLASAGNAEEFAVSLRRHQQGHTDYFTFCRQSAGAGVERWIVDMETMTCTYFDRAGVRMLSETIPQVG